MYLQRTEDGRIAIMENGQEVNRLMQLPHFNVVEEPSLKKRIEDEGVPHLIMGDTFFVYEPYGAEAEKVSLRFKDSEERMTVTMLSEGTIKRAKVFWERFLKQDPVKRRH